MKLLLSILFFFCGIRSIACSCDEVGTVKSSVENSDYVIYGKVINTAFVNIIETTDSLQREALDLIDHDMLKYPTVLKASFIIYKNYKGNIQSDTITVFTPAQSSACGFRFIPNQEYVIYGESESFIYDHVRSITKAKLEGNEMPETVWTNHCSRTTEYINSEVRAIEEYLSQE